MFQKNKNNVSNHFGIKTFKPYRIYNMKKISSIIIISALLISCGSKKTRSTESVIESKDLAKIKAKKSEITTLQAKYAAEIKLLNNAISDLDSNKKITKVSSFLATEKIFNHYVELQGNVSTKNLVVIYPEFAGNLNTIYVKEGQKVSKGETLAKIDDGGLNQQLSQLKIQADLAKTTYERQEKLWKQKIGSELQYLQAKSNYEAQEQAIKQLQKQINKTIIIAPFSGTIDEIITEQGNFVSPGATPIMRIVNLNNMLIDIDVPERHITSVTLNKNVVVNIPVLNKTINTTVNQVGSFINPANRTFKVEVLIPNKDQSIKPNLTAKISINDYTNKTALLIPQNIILENAKGQQYIYIVSHKKGSEGVAKKQIIVTGKMQGDVIEVLEGISHNTEIIDEGSRNIKDGQTVTIANI